MEIIKFSVGDRLIMKKKHPCQSNVFSVMRIGTDVRVICSGCGRDMTMPRVALEKMIRRVESGQNEQVKV